MKTATLAQVKKGHIFYTAKEYEKYGDTSKYIRIKDEYDASTKTWYCPRYFTDALGEGKYLKPSTPVVII